MIKMFPKISRYNKFSEFEPDRALYEYHITWKIERLIKFLCFRLFPVKVILKVF